MVSSPPAFSLQFSWPLLLLTLRQALPAAAHGCVSVCADTPGPLFPSFQGKKGWIPTPCALGRAKGLCAPLPPQPGPIPPAAGPHPEGVRVRRGGPAGWAAPLAAQAVSAPPFSPGSPAVNRQKGFTPSPRAAWPGPGAARHPHAPPWG